MILTSCTVFIIQLIIKRVDVLKILAIKNEKGYEISLLAYPFRDSYLQESIYVMIPNKVANVSMVLPSSRLCL
jgi:hypothetical protein